MVREDRTSKGLSRRAYAKKIGISHTYLGTLERGISEYSGGTLRPSVETLQLLSDYFDIPVGKLLEMSGEMPEGSHDEFMTTTQSEIQRLIEDPVLRKVTQNFTKLSATDQKMIQGMIERLVENVE